MRVTLCDNCGDEVEEHMPTCSIDVYNVRMKVGGTETIEGDYCAECSNKIREGVEEALQR